MSYNIHHANPPGKPGFIDLDAIAAVIKKEDPDFVGLQEVDRFTGRSGKVDEAEILAQKTGLYHHFFKAIDHDGGAYGVAILSRFPILKTTQLNLPQVFKGEARILASATIAIAKNLKITFANTHLDAQRPDSNRLVQMQAALKSLENDRNPTFIVGDFNCEPGSVPVQLLDAQFKRSCLSNCGFTIPQVSPKKTIDYIALKNANWPVQSHVVIPEVYASDHRPLVATYQIPENKPKSK